MTPMDDRERKRREQNMKRPTTACAFFLVLPLGLTLTGCYEEVGTKQTPARTANTETVDDDDRSRTPAVRTGGSSVHGKSKQAAKRTLGKVGDRQKELEKEIDDQDN